MFFLGSGSLRDHYWPYRIIGPSSTTLKVVWFLVFILVKTYQNHLELV